MDMVFYHQVKIYREPGEYEWEKDVFEIKEFNILIQNDKYVILDNDSWTKLEKDSGSYSSYNVIGKECISVAVGDNYSRDGVFYTSYSETKIDPATIREHIEEKIEEKYGWFVRELDLGIIK